MEKLLGELRYSALAFSKELEYKSHSTIDHILKSQNKISENLRDRIIKKFPEVNYWFLKKGKMPILLNDKLKRNQNNLFSSFEPKKDINYELETFLVLKNIEKLLIDISEKIINV